MRNISGIIIHCTATNSSFMPGATTSQRVKEIKRWHVEDNGWRDIGYHYLIDRDGTVAAGRPVTKTGAHVRGHNTGTIAIALFGGRTSTTTDAFEDNFTAKQEVSLRLLISELQSKYGPMKVTGHNQYANKACPGFNAEKWYKAAAKPMLDRQPSQPVAVPDAPVAVPDEVVELIEETEADHSKTDLYNRILQYVTGGGFLAALPNINEILREFDPIVIAAVIVAGAGIFAVATYTRNSRKRKGKKAEAAATKLKMMGVLR